MTLIDFLLNAAALLLWLNWRALRFDPLASRAPATLLGTLRPAAPRGGRSWQLAGGVLLLIVGRAFLYWYLASPVDWTPRLDLGFIVLAFRSDQFLSELAFSLMSFLRVGLVFYFWLLVLGLLQKRTNETEPVGRWVRLHLGHVGRWAWWVQLVAPVLLVALLWVACHPLLVRLGVSSPPRSMEHLAEQGLLIGLQLWFSLKYLLVPLLVIHLVATYVYLGNSPVWDFVSGTSRTALAPLQALPLRLTRLDFAPVIGALVVVLVLHWMPLMVQTTMARHQLSLWPQ